MAASSFQKEKKDVSLRMTKYLTISRELYKNRATIKNSKTAQNP
jgi:hypothetical protein